MELYDSDNPDAIPDGVWAAGYVDGYAAPAWAARGWARFPGARRIAVFPGGNVGDTFDVEWLDLTAEQAPAEVIAAHARGIAVPWVYVSRATRAAVEQALVMAGIGSNQVALWIATLDGTVNVRSGPYPVAAVQYLNSAHSGGHYDRSIVNPLFGAAGGGLEDDLSARAEQLIEELHNAVGRLEIAFGTASPAGPAPGGGPDYLGFLNNELRAGLGQIAAIKTELDGVAAEITALAGGGGGPVDPDAASVAAIGVKLDRILAELHTP